MSKGRPTIALRLDKWQIAGLKLIARRNGLTVSDLIREMIDSLLLVNGIGASSEELPGQITTNDLIDA